MKAVKLFNEWTSNFHIFISNEGLHMGEYIKYFITQQDVI